MPESITKTYKRLFEVRILHHYWLDEGSTVFDQIPDQAKKDQRLLSYDMRSFLAVSPTAATKKLLSSFGCLFRETSVGFVVTAPGTATLPTDTVFNFAVTVKDSRFYDYTALTMRPPKIYEFDNKLDKTIYRYKENVPFLSNLTGTTRDDAANKLLFLSREPPTLRTDDLVESLYLSGSALVQLTSDGPSATTQQLGAQADELPAFLHQGDVPTIVPPAGLENVPARGIRLSDDVTDDVFALLSLTAVCPGNSEFSFVDEQDPSKAIPRVYQVRFKNRSTFWRYLNKRTGSEVTPIGGSPFPLTFFGNAGSKQKPSDGAVKAETSGARITRLISEIYI